MLMNRERENGGIKEGKEIINTQDRYSAKCTETTIAKGKTLLRL